MKKTLLTSCFFFFCFLFANATIHQVSVLNFQFSPRTLPNVLVGDTIDWIWQNGAHTTTSTTIPGGAAAWDEPMNSTSTTYRYIVAVAGTYNYVCTPHAPDMSGSFVATDALPVILTDFNAIGNDKQSILNWVTASEEQTDYFSVRRSIDGATYSEIGRVPAAGNSQTQRVYSFIDKNLPGNKYLYYVVVIVDKDGKTQYSPVRLVVNGKATSKLILSLSPNPIHRPGHLMLTFNADAEGAMDAVLLNMEGKSMLQVSLSAVKGINNGHIHLGEIAPGTYNLVFYMKGIRETHTVIVQ